MSKVKNSCVRNCANHTLINQNIKIISKLSNQFETVSAILKLTGNPTRLKVLHILNEDQDICVCDLSDILNISISAVSQQLKKLKEGGLILNRKENQTIYYFINPNSKTVLDYVFSIFNLMNKSQDGK